MREFDGRVGYAVENLGDSPLARRFGVTRYPAIFVGDVLVATPKDFGFFGKGEGADVARYAPFRSAEGHDHFRRDLRRAIGLVLAGDATTARAEAPPTRTTGLAALPAVDFVDLDGRRVTRDDLLGRPVLVEFWATWCPPCHTTLAWLGELKRTHGDRLVVVTLAVDSDAATVRAQAAKGTVDAIWAMATPELARGFGDVSAFPTLYLFGSDGTTAATWYGAVPGLHDEAAAALARLLR